MIRFRTWLAGSLCFLGSALEASSQEVTLVGKISERVLASIDPKLTPAAALDLGCPGCAVGTVVKITFDGGRPNKVCDGVGRDECSHDYQDNQIVVTAGARSWAMKGYYAAVSTVYGSTNRGQKIVVRSRIVIDGMPNRVRGPIGIVSHTDFMTAQALVDSSGALVPRMYEPFVADYRHVPVPVQMILSFSRPCSYAPKEVPGMECGLGAIRVDFESVATGKTPAGLRVK